MQAPRMEVVKPTDPKRTQSAAKRSLGKEKEGTYRGHGHPHYDKNRTQTGRATPHVYDYLASYTTDYEGTTLQSLPVCS